MTEKIEITQGAENMKEFDINGNMYDMIVKKLEKNNIWYRSDTSTLHINARDLKIDNILKNDRHWMSEIPESQIVKMNEDKVIQNPEKIQMHAIIKDNIWNYYIILKLNGVEKSEMKKSVIEALTEKPKDEKTTILVNNTKKEIKDTIEEPVNVVELLKNYWITDGVSFLENWINGNNKITEEDLEKIGNAIDKTYKNDFWFIKFVINSLNWNFFLSFYNFMKKNAEDKENKINMYDFFLSNRFDSYMTIWLNIGELPIFKEKKPSAIDGEEITMMLMKDFCKSKSIDENETLPVFRDLIVREPRKSNVILRTIFSTNRDEKIEYIWKKLQEKNK